MFDGADMLCAMAAGAFLGVTAGSWWAGQWAQARGRAAIVVGARRP